MSVTSVPLVDGLTLTVHGAPHERFARVFRETWQRLPIDVRAQILTRPPHINLGGHPQVSPIAIACVTPGGRAAWFHPGLDSLRAAAVKEPSTVKPTADGAIAFIVAHELAHVFRSPTRPGPQDEAAVAVLVKAWGFDEVIPVLPGSPLLAGLEK